MISRLWPIGLLGLSSCGSTPLICPEPAQLPVELVRPVDQALIDRLNSILGQTSPAAGTNSTGSGP